MAETSRGEIACPLCAAPIDRATMSRCPNCGMDATDARVDDVLDSQRLSREYKATYDDVLTKWHDLDARRQGWLAGLESTRAAASTPVSAGVQPSFAPSDTSDEWAGLVTAEPSVLVSPPPSAPAKATVPARPPREVRPPRPRRLTAPAMLGVSGASLLIAAAIVFIAVTWDSFLPLAQGMIVLALAGGIGYLSLWLARHELVISSGAVGVVGMAFVGVSIIAFDREATVLGSYSLPVAMLTSSAAGLWLSRKKVLWVRSVAALALVGAASGYALAVWLTREDAFPGVTTLAGCVAALAVAGTYPLWADATSRWMIRVGAAAILTASATPSVSDLLQGGGARATVAVAAVLPAFLLAFLARWWPRLTVPPAALLVTGVAGAAVGWNADKGWALAITAVAATILVVVVASSVAPLTWRNPALIGLAPAAAVVAWGVVPSVGSMIDRLAQATGTGGVAPAPLDYGSALVLGGVAVAALRLWKPRPAWLSRRQPWGAAGLALGLTAASLAAGDLDSGRTATGMAVATTVGAISAFGAVLLWDAPRAQRTAAWSATVLASIAGWNAVRALAATDSASGAPIWTPLGLALVSPIVLLVAGRWWVGMTVAPAALLVTATAAAAVLGGGGTAAQAAAMAAGIVAVTLWSGIRLPKQWKVPILVGIFPALAVSIAASLSTTLPVLPRLFGSWDGSTWTTAAWGNPDRWSSATTLLAGISLAALTWWKISSRVTAVLSVVGALMMVISAATAAAALSGDWWGDPEFALASTGVVAALISVAFLGIWATSAARWTHGIGATVLLTIAGVHGSIALAADPRVSALGIGVVMAPVAILVIFARWWPAVTLGPAAFLVTVAAAAVGHHAGVSTHGLLTVAIAGAALLAWAGVMLTPRWRRPVFAGLVPVLWVGAIYSVIIGALAVGQSLSTRNDVLTRDDFWWATGSAVLLAASLLSLRAWSAPPPRAAIGAVCGAIAAAAAATMATAATSMTWPAWSVVLPLAATGYSLLAAVTIPLWWTRAARWTVGLGAMGWLTVANLDAMTDLTGGGRYWLPGIVAALVAIAVLAVASRWWPRSTLGSAALLASRGVWVAVAGAGGTRVSMLFGLALVVAVVCWLAALGGPRRSRPLLLGLIPAGLVLAVPVLDHASAVVEQFGRALTRGAEYPTAPEWAGIVVAVAVATLSFAKVRAHVGWAMLPFIFVASGGFPRSFAWIIVLGLAVLAFVVVVRVPAWRTRVTPGVTIALVAIAVGWSAGSETSLAVTTLTATSMLMWLATTQSGARREWAVVLAPLVGALAVAHLVWALDGSTALALGAAMVSAFILLITGAKIRRDTSFVLAAATGAAATLGTALFAPSLTTGGVLLLLAGAGWLAFTVVGWRPGRWAASVSLSAGVAMILASADVQTIEAYTAVPAVCVLLIGLWWLKDDDEVSTVRALGPGLSLALVPSYVAVAAQPESLVRTLALTAATVVLALVGVRMRWFAPILATTVTAVTVSGTQVVVGSSIVPRWVSFAIVGGLLLVIAAVYEKLKKLR